MYMLRAAAPNQSHYLCEYACNPFDDCYCRKVTGRSVGRIALYCMERFRECPVYRTKHAPAVPVSARGTGLR